MQYMLLNSVRFGSFNAAQAAFLKHQICSVNEVSGSIFCDDYKQFKTMGKNASRCDWKLVLMPNSGLPATSCWTEATMAVRGSFAVREMF